MTTHHPELMLLARMQLHLQQGVDLFLVSWLSENLPFFAEGPLL